MWSFRLQYLYVGDVFFGVCVCVCVVCEQNKKNSPVPPLLNCGLGLLLALLLGSLQIAQGFETSDEVRAGDPTILGD